MNNRSKRLLKSLAALLSLLLLLGAAWWLAVLIAFATDEPSPGTRDMALADLDGDGDLDAFLANGMNESFEPDSVLLNDGAGRFEDSGQRLGQAESKAVALYDVDDDGDLDAVVSTTGSGYYFWNDGSADFSLYRAVWLPEFRDASGVWTYSPARLDPDGRVDLFLAGCCGGGYSTGDGVWHPVQSFNAVWLNDGDPLPQNTPSQVQTFGRGSTAEVALGDLDGDGDLDAFMANNQFLDQVGEPVPDANQVWFNNGLGHFADSGQHLGDRRSTAVALGDLDGDGDLDALVGNHGPDEVWLNNGRGSFTNSGQAIGDYVTRFLHLADLDGDGDLDVFLGDHRRGRIWLNDGQAYFEESGQQFRYSSEHALALGDVNGDGFVDLVAGRLDEALVWLNDGTGSMRVLSAPSRGDEASHE